MKTITLTETEAQSILNILNNIPTTVGSYLQTIQVLKQIEAIFQQKFSALEEKLDEA